MKIFILQNRVSYILKALPIRCPHRPDDSRCSKGNDIFFSLKVGGSHTDLYILT